MIMTANPGISIQQITNQIIDFKQSIYEMLENGLNRPGILWLRDRDILQGMVDVAKIVAANSINGAVKMTLMILIDNSLYIIEEINDKIKDLMGPEVLEQKEVEEAVEKICRPAMPVEQVVNEPESLEIKTEALAADPVKSIPQNSIQVQRIFNRNKNGHSYKTFLYLEQNKELHQMTNNELKRKNYRGDIYGFQKFLCDKGHMIGTVPVVNMPDMVRK